MGGQPHRVGFSLTTFLDFNRFGKTISKTVLGPSTQELRCTVLMFLLVFEGLPWFPYRCHTWTTSTPIGTGWTGCSSSKSESALCPSGRTQDLTEPVDPKKAQPQLAQQDGNLPTLELHDPTNNQLGSFIHLSTSWDKRCHPVAPAAVCGKTRSPESLFSKEHHLQYSS